MQPGHTDVMENFAADCSARGGVLKSGFVADYPPLLTAGTSVFGAGLCHLTAGRRRVGAFGCGKNGVGCRHVATAAGRGETAADKTRAHAGRWGTAAEVRRQCRHIRQKKMVVR